MVFMARFVHIDAERTQSLLDRQEKHTAQETPWARWRVTQHGADEPRPRAGGPSSSGPPSDPDSTMTGDSAIPDGTQQ